MDPIRDFTSAQEAFGFSQGSYHITVMSEKQARQFASEPHESPSAMISIQDTENFDEVHPVTASKILSILHIHFEDTNLPMDREDRSLNWFTEKDANRIKRFITDEVLAKDIKYIYVHCHAGVSRSSAVAAALEIYLNGASSDEHIWKDWHYRPNIRVYTVLTKVLGVGMARSIVNNKVRINGIVWRRHMLQIRKTLKTKEELDHWQDIWDRMSSDWYIAKRQRPAEPIQAD